MGNKIIETLSALTASSEDITEDILLLKFTVVNACMIGNPKCGEEKWVLVDTGLENSADFIVESAEKRFGKERRPQAIVLTHGHFDHVGSVITLADRWNVPVYIHELELPYITSEKDYPVGDPSVGGGTVSQISPSFPHTSIDIRYRAVKLPADGSIPGLDGWEWIHTPGHTQGHISLFRKSDRIILAGDALSTVKQESLLSVISQKVQISGPPAYLTEDWRQAEESVKKLRDLDPSLLIPSHGKPIKGEGLSRELDILAARFDEIAKPENGKFID